MHTLRLLGLATLAFCLTLMQTPVFAQAYGTNLTVTASTGLAQANEPFVYTVTVRNPYGTEQKNADVLLTVDNDLKVESTTAGGTASNKIKWKVTLPPYGSTVLQATVRPKSNVGDHGILTSVAAGLGGTATSQLPVMNDESSLDDRLLKVEILPGRPVVQPGETFEYCIVVTDLNWKRVSNVDVDVELSPFLEVLSANNGGKASGNRVRWSAVDILGQNGRQLKVSVRVLPGAKDGDLLEALATSEGITAKSVTHVTDPNQNNEQVTAFVYPTVSAARIGEEVKYIINVESLGRKSERLDILAYIDARTNFVSASDNALLLEKYTVRFDDLLLDAHGTKTLELVVRVKEGIDSVEPLGITVQAGSCRVQDRLDFDRSTVLVSQTAPTQSGTASVSSSGVGSSASNASVEGVSLSVVPVEGEVAPGATVQLALRLTNTGLLPSDGVSVRVQLPRDAAEVTNAGGGEKGFQSLRWFIPALQAGETWERNIAVQVRETVLNGDSIAFVTTAQTASREKPQTIISTFGVQNLAPQAGVGLQQAFVPVAHAAGTSEWTVRRVGEHNASSDPSVGWLVTHIAFWTLVIVAGFIVVAKFALARLR